MSKILSKETTMKDECLICGAPLKYAETETQMECAICRKKENGKGSDFSPRMAIYILIMAVCLFFSSYTKTLAADYLSSVTLYPLCQGLSLVGSIIMAALFFGEKPNAKCIFGVCLAFASLMIINFL